MEQSSNSKTFVFQLGGSKFAIEVFDRKKIGLSRFYGIVADLAGLEEIEQSQIMFLYKGNEIFYLDWSGAYDGEPIVIHTPKTQINSSQVSKKPENKCIYKLHLHLHPNTLQVWSVCPSPSTISDILKPLIYDDDFIKIFTSKFQIFHKNKKIPKKSSIENFQNLSEFHIRLVPPQNPIKLSIKYTKNPIVECYFDYNCKWKTVVKNMLLYFRLKDANFYHKRDLIIWEEFRNERIGNMNLHRNIEVIDIDKSNLNHFYNKIEFNSRAPDYRIVADGLNFKCRCNESNCSMKNEIFIECMAYGVYKLSLLKEKLLCLKCKKKAEIKSFGIYNAFLKVFITIGEEKKMEQFENFKNFYVSFDYFLRKFKNVSEIEFDCSLVR